MKSFITTIALLLIAFCTAQQLQQKIDMTLDPLGNAKVNISMQMNASQWEVWSNTVGNNPAALKREVERAMPGYFLDDFQINRDDMNRSFNLNLNAYGICKIDKKDNWTLETEQKNAQLTEITDHKYMLVSSPPELGGQIQQIYTLQFPENAKDIKVDKDAFGESIFSFKMDNPTTSGNSKNYLRYSGIALLLLGAGWLGMSLISKNSR